MKGNWPQLRFTMFLVLLLTLLFVALPSRTAAGGESIGLKILYSLTILTGLYAIKEHRTLLTLATLAAVPLLALTWTGFNDQSIFVIALRRTLTAVMFVVIAGAIVGEVMRTLEVSTDTIAGGICVYVLLGAIWTYAYLAIYAIDPTAFHFPDASTVSELIRPADGRLAYFSFVTLTTLGYGDLHPVSAAACASATLEALTGQIYITVFIARLVGLHISRAI